MPDEPDVTGKRPPCLARVREPGPPARAGGTPKIGVRPPFFSNALLAHENGAGRMLHRRCARRAAAHHSLDRGPQLPGAQFHARPDARRRRRAVLSLELRGAGHRRPGRYLPESNATRARAGSFLKLVRTPALATEVTLQPLERFPLDAAILFSDILTVPDAMGLGLAFSEGEGPRFERPLRDEAAIRKLAAPDPSAELGYVLDAVREARRALAGRVPLIGFSGSPFTLACYMVEGAGSDDWRTLKTMLHARPELLHRILEVNARAVTDYPNAQIETGAQAVMIFDTWGGILSHEDYERFSLSYCRKIFEKLLRQREGSRVPSILFTKGGSPWLAAMMKSGCDAVGLDWSADAREARRV